LPFRFGKCQPSISCSVYHILPCSLPAPLVRMVPLLEVLQLMILFVGIKIVFSNYILYWFFLLIKILVVLNMNVCIPSFSPSLLNFYYCLNDASCFVLSFVPVYVDVPISVFYRDFRA
jgi:hypothetical protein